MAKKPGILSAWTFAITIWNYGTWSNRQKDLQEQTLYVYHSNWQLQLPPCTYPLGWSSMHSWVNHIFPSITRQKLINKIDWWGLNSRVTQDQDLIIYSIIEPELSCICDLQPIQYLRLRFLLIEVGISLIDFLLCVSSANSSGERLIGTSLITSSSCRPTPADPSVDWLLIEPRELFTLCFSVLRMPCLNAFSEGRPRIDRNWWLGNFLDKSSSAFQGSTSFSLRSSSSSSSYPALVPLCGLTWTTLELLLW